MLPLLLAAAAAAPGDGESEIVVVASSREYRLTGKELRAAQAAFVKYRPAYAPAAQLWFELASADGRALPEGLMLTLANGDRRLPIEFGSGHRFRVPPLDNGEWRLLANRKGLRLKVEPWVFSPGSTLGDWRLGDLRLQCRVGWGIVKQSTSLVIAGMFDMVGGCESKRIGIYQSLHRPIAAATLSEAGKSRPVEFMGGDKLRLPVNIKAFGNEARVRVSFR